MADVPAAEPKYLTPEQVAKMLQVSVRSVYRLTKKYPAMPRLNLGGGALRFPPERLSRWLRQQEEGPAQPKRLAIVKAEAR